MEEKIMTTRKFLTSVANVYAYNDATGALLFVGKTLLDTSIATTLAKTDVKGGYGNQLLYVYYHTADMTITISDSQWNLDFLSKAVGNDIKTGDNVFTEETITLTSGGAGTVTGTPIAVTGSTIYGWVTQVDGDVERVTFAGSTFSSSSGTSGDEVCVRYYALDTAARSITINANIIPDIVHLVLEAQLNSSDSTTNQIGVVQIDIPRATLSGAFTIKMTPDGVASTPLEARALANPGTDVADCNNVDYYATIKEILYNVNWWDNVIGIAIEGGDITQAVGVTGTTLHVWAVPQTGLPFLCPIGAGSSGYMTFASGTTATATIGAASGVITGVTGGTSMLHAFITAAPTMDAYVDLTITYP
jgi:hypothetical protein